MTAVLDRSTAQLTQDDFDAPTNGHPEPQSQDERNEEGPVNVADGLKRALAAVQDRISSLTADRDGIDRQIAALRDDAARAVEFSPPVKVGLAGVKVSVETPAPAPKPVKRKAPAAPTDAPDLIKMFADEPYAMSDLVKLFGSKDAAKAASEAKGVKRTGKARGTRYTRSA